METINHRQKHEPFSFWLASTFLQAEEKSQEPPLVTNREFLAMSALIVAAFSLFAWFVGPFGL